MSPIARTHEATAGADAMDCAMTCAMREAISAGVAIFPVSSLDFCLKRRIDESFAGKSWAACLQILDVADVSKDFSLVKWEPTQFAIDVQP